MKKSNKKSKNSAVEAQAIVTTEATANVEATEATTEKKSTLKQSRWVKVHEQGQSSFEVKDNVMDITIGEGLSLIHI